MLLIARLGCVVPTLHRSLDESGSSVSRKIAESEEGVEGEGSLKVVIVFQGRN